jgi:hypothetical protein
MKLIQFVLLIMLAAGLQVANAAETGKKADCPKMKNSSWVNQQKELEAAKYLQQWDGPKGQETFRPAPKATR